jgi:hypothetical protein
MDFAVSSEVVAHKKYPLGICKYDWFVYTSNSKHKSEIVALLGRWDRVKSKKARWCVLGFVPGEGFRVVKPESIKQKIDRKATSKEKQELDRSYIHTHIHTYEYT